MTRSTLVALLPFALMPGAELATHYTTERALRIEASTEFQVEVVEFSVTRDGDPTDGGRGASAGSAFERSVVTIDTVIAEEDGTPTIVRREFESIESNLSMSTGDSERELQQDCPLDGVTIELTSDDGDVSVEVVDGPEPDDLELLQGHSLTLALDALLPGQDVDAGDVWDVPGDDLARALGFDIDEKLFLRPEREEDGGREEGGRGGRRGGRGAPPTAGQYFRFGDWEVEATLGDETEDYEGQECYVITIEAQASGELPDRERGGRRGERDGRALNGPSASALLETTFEADLEGTLHVSMEDRHPVHFELEGTIDEEMLHEMERRGSVMSISSVKEATLKYSVDISAIVR